VARESARAVMQLWQSGGGDRLARTSALIDIPLRADYCSYPLIAGQEIAEIKLR